MVNKRPKAPLVQNEGPPCPLRARSEEHLRAVTVAHGQTRKIAAGHGIARAETGSDIEFPS